MTFHTTLISGGGNTSGIHVPEDIVLGLGRGRRVPVLVTLNGDYTFRNTIAFMGGQFLVGVSAAHRAATGLAVGDPVEVTLEVDDAPRVVEVPPELAEALAADPVAAQAWAALSYSHQRQHAEPIAAAKAADTRARRVQKTLAILRGEG
nr:YdeI/OmpD-associated family protein [Klugiella xanthotipulae]